MDRSASANRTGARKWLVVRCNMKDFAREFAARGYFINQTVSSAGQIPFSPPGTGAVASTVRWYTPS